MEPHAWAAQGTFGDSESYRNRRKASLRKSKEVLEAMIEPTPGMIARINEKYGPDAVLIVRQTWPILIGTILAEKTDSPD